jgi:hypothetical protein
MGIYSANYRQPVGPMLPEIWLHVLGRELNAEEFERACEGHLKRSRFFPTVADILQVAEEQRNEPKLCETPTAQKLFARYKKKNAEEEARRAGKDGPVQNALSDGK